MWVCGIMGGWGWLGWGMWVGVGEEGRAGGGTGRAGGGGWRCGRRAEEVAAWTPPGRGGQGRETAAEESCWMDVGRGDDKGCSILNKRQGLRRTKALGTGGTCREWGRRRSAVGSSCSQSNHQLG